MLNKAGNDPIKLLLMFHKRRPELLEDRQDIRKALRNAFCTDHALTRHNTDMLGLLKKHRDQAQHPEERAVYGQDDLRQFLAEVWRSGWLVQFLSIGQKRS